MSSPRKSSHKLPQIHKTYPALVKSQTSSVSQQLHLPQNPDRRRSSAVSTSGVEYEARIRQLEQLVEHLRHVIRDKHKDDVDSSELDDEANDGYYKRLFEEEMVAHEDTISEMRLMENSLEKTSGLLENSGKELSSVYLELQDKTAFAEQLQSNSERQLVSINTMHAQAMELIKSEKDLEVLRKEKQIKNLKLQIRQILKGDSEDRRQQIEELNQELLLVADQSSAMRVKYKAMLKARSQQPCVRCPLLQAELQMKNDKLTESEDAHQILYKMCKNFEQELFKQEALLAEIEAFAHRKSPTYSD